MDTVEERIGEDEVVAVIKTKPLNCPTISPGAVGLAAMQVLANAIPDCQEKEAIFGLTSLSSSGVVAEQLDKVLRKGVFTPMKSKQTYDLCGNCQCRVYLAPASNIGGAWAHLESVEHSTTSDVSTCGCLHATSSSEGKITQTETEAQIQTSDLVFDELSKMPEMKSISVETLEEVARKIAGRISKPRWQTKPPPVINQVSSELVTSTTVNHSHLLPSISIGGDGGPVSTGYRPTTIEFEGQGKLVAEYGQLKWISASGKTTSIA